MFDLGISDFITVYIDGFPSTHWRLCISERPSIPIPERQVQVDEVIGRLGAFYTKYGYKDMDVDLTFNFLEDFVDFKSFKQQLPHIRHWLEAGEKLEFSDEPELYYLMRNVRFNGDIDNEVVEFGEFTVTVTLAPFARVYEEEGIHVIPEGTNTNTNLTTTIFNSSIETSYPRFEFDFSMINQSVTIETSDRDGNITYSFTLLDPSSSSNAIPLGSKIVMDSESKTVYWIRDTQPDVKNYISKYTIGDTGFPQLVAGVNIVRVKDIGGRLGFLDIFRNPLR